MRNFFSLVLSFFIIMACVPAVSLFFREEILENRPATHETTTAVATEKKEDVSNSTSPSLFLPRKRTRLEYTCTRRKKLSVSAPAFTPSPF